MSSLFRVSKGYVTTIFGRRRLLPGINSTDPCLRSQSERQAVNFVIQGMNSVSRNYLLPMPTLRTPCDVIRFACMDFYRICSRYLQDGNDFGRSIFRKQEFETESKVYKMNFVMF